MVCHRSLGLIPMETDLQKLISEYCAIERMVRIVRSADRASKTELIGLIAREFRHREILLETNRVDKAAPLTFLLSA